MTYEPPKVSPGCSYPAGVTATLLQMDRKTLRKWSSTPVRQGGIKCFTMKGSKRKWFPAESITDFWERQTGRKCIETLRNVRY